MGRHIVIYTYICIYLPLRTYIYSQIPVMIGVYYRGIYKGTDIDVRYVTDHSISVTFMQTPNRSEEEQLPEYRNILNS